MYTIYTKPNCNFCDQAKAFLRSKDLKFEEIRITPEGVTEGTGLNGNRTILIEHFKALYPSQTTVPLILKDGNKIGGFKELKESLNILLG